MKKSLVIFLAAIASVSAYAGDVEPGTCAAIAKHEGYYKLQSKTCDTLLDGELGVVPYETNAPEGPGSAIQQQNGPVWLVPASYSKSIWFTCEETEGKLVVKVCPENCGNVMAPVTFTFGDKTAQLTDGNCKAEYTKDRDYVP